ncbi:MAG: hypothetical protein KC439_05945 [Yoonia sp.]|nr:hypothetical protein [Yoonia sp.]
MRNFLFVHTAIAALIISSAAAAQDKLMVTGAIQQFECGDNCYLTIMTDYGEETGLCNAPMCDLWFLEGEMPASLIGRAVVVEVGVGMRFDNAGSPMGLLIAFDEIEFLNN